MQEDDKVKEEEEEEEKEFNRLKELGQVVSICLFVLKKLEIEKLRKILEFSSFC